jgi:tetratricopeptide (TPR) repeat protein
MNLWGAAQFEIGQLEGAELAFKRAVELGEQEDDPLLVARATNNLGQIANVRGRRVDALVMYQLAVPAYQRLGNTRGLAESYHNMAISYRDLGELQRADECEQQAIEFARAVPAARLAALARIGWAELALRRGDSAEAAAALERASGFAARHANPLLEGETLRARAQLAAARGMMAEARQHAEAALALFERAGATTEHAELLAWCARLPEE